MGEGSSREERRTWEKCAVPVTLSHMKLSLLKYVWGGQGLMINSAVYEAVAGSQEPWDTMYAGWVLKDDK